MQAKHLLEQNLHPEMNAAVLKEWEEHLNRQQYVQVYHLRELQLAYALVSLLNKMLLIEIYRLLIHPNERSERKSYYRRRDSAIMDPTTSTSIIVDGMDQAKTNLPHFRGWSNPKVHATK